MKHYYWVIALTLTLWAFHTPVLAAPQVRTPEETVKIVEELSQILGPEIGSLLYEAYPVLVIARLQPMWVLSSESLEENPEMSEKLAILGKKHNLDLRLGYQNLKIVSKEKLEAYTKENKLAWVVPYSRTDDLEEWSDKLDEAASEEIDGLTVASGMAFLQGAPEFVIAAELQARLSPLVSDRLVTVAYPKIKVLLSDEIDLRILPEDASSPILNAWLLKRESYLESFYQTGRVQETLRSPDFLKLRQAAREGDETLNYSESWWRKENFDSFGILSYPDSEVEHYEEQILQAHYQELVSMIEKDSPPRSWLRMLNRHCILSGNQPTIQGAELATWIWQGAYGKTPSRLAVYEAINKKKPEYGSAVAKAKITEWLDYRATGGPNMFASPATAKLYHHPIVRRYYGKLSPAERQDLNDKLKPFLEDEACRAVLVQNPYKLQSESEIK